jgi:hypothetical protein
MIAILDKSEPDTESMKGLNLAVARHTTIQETKLPL